VKQAIVIRWIVSVSMRFPVGRAKMNLDTARSQRAISGLQRGLEKVRPGSVIPHSRLDDFNRLTVLGVERRFDPLLEPEGLDLGFGGWRNRRFAQGTGKLVFRSGLWFHTSKIIYEISFFWKFSVFSFRFSVEELETPGSQAAKEEGFWFLVSGFS
jgi:hypothetical protein